LPAGGEYMGVQVCASGHPRGAGRALRRTHTNQCLRHPAKTRNYRTTSGYASKTSMMRSVERSSRNPYGRPDIESPPFFVLFTSSPALSNNVKIFEIAHTLPVDFAKIIEIGSLRTGVPSR
jgi:hypothetical protein